LLDEFQGLGWVGLVGVEPAAQVFCFVEGNDREERVSGQGQVLRRVDPSVPMVVFHPLTGVFFIVVFVLNSPVVADHSGGSRQFSKVVARVEAAQEIAGVVPHFEVWIFEVFEIHPGALALEGAARVGQASFDRADGGVAVFAVVEATVTTFGLV